MDELDPQSVRGEGVSDRISGFSDDGSRRELIPTDPPGASSVIVSSHDIRAFLRGAFSPDGTPSNPDGIFDEIDAFSAHARNFMGHVESQQAALTRDFRIALADALDSADDIIDDTDSDGLPCSDDHRPSAEA